MIDDVLTRRCTCIANERFHATYCKLGDGINVKVLEVRELGWSTVELPKSWFAGILPEGGQSWRCYRYESTYEYTCSILFLHLPF